MMPVDLEEWKRFLGGLSDEEIDAIARWRLGEPDKGNS